MQRGAPQGSLSLPPSLTFLRSFVRPSNPYEAHEPRGDRQRRVTDGCAHRWIDRTIHCVVCALFLFFFPPLPLSPHRAHIALHPSSFSLALLVLRASRYHRDYTERGKQEGVQRDRHGPSPSRWIYSRSPVCIFIYEIAAERDAARGRMDGQRLRAAAILSGRGIN